MNMNNQQRVIDYVLEASQETEEPVGDMATIRRGLGLYIHQLRLNFSFVLLLALAICPQ